MAVKFSREAHMVANEMYAIGHLLSCILAGRESIPNTSGSVSTTIHRSMVLDLKQPQHDVCSLNSDHECIEAFHGTARLGVIRWSQYESANRSGHSSVAGHRADTPRGARYLVGVSPLRL